MRWSETKIESSEGPKIAIAPEIISASRSTDIPAFYSEWFINRLKAGFVKWINPFNKINQFISFERTKAIVFWSKNPRPLIRFLDYIDDRLIFYYFQFTLNDYEGEGYEPGLPSLLERVDTFKTLSNRIGKERVIWRFDPLFLSDNLNVPKLLEKLKRVGDLIAPFTERLVFSFADISPYAKVSQNLNQKNINFNEFSNQSMLELGESISILCKRWGIGGFTCAEKIDLSNFGIMHNKCIDGDLILKITNNAPEIQRLLGIVNNEQGNLFDNVSKVVKDNKDRGQRAECGCVFSKDIGQYNTCLHLCVYCYANNTEELVRKNFNSSSIMSESIF